MYCIQQPPANLQTCVVQPKVTGEWAVCQRVKIPPLPACLGGGAGICTRAQLKFVQQLCIFTRVLEHGLVAVEISSQSRCIVSSSVKVKLSAALEEMSSAGTGVCKTTLHVFKCESSSHSQYRLVSVYRIANCAIIQTTVKAPNVYFSSVYFSTAWSSDRRVCNQCCTAVLTVCHKQMPPACLIGWV